MTIRKGRIDVKKKLIALLLSGSVLTMALSGCGSSQLTEENAAEEEVVDTTQGQELPSGKVELTVWAEENSYDMLEGMFETFKQEYAGQAEFDIKLAPQSYVHTKEGLLADIHNEVDIFTIPDDQLLTMIAAGALSLVPNPDKIRNENVEEAVTAATYKDILFAYPYTADNGYFLYYDKNYLTETDVQTLDGILAVAEENGKAISMDFGSGWYLYSFFGGTGMELGLNEDGVTNYCDWNRTEGTIKGVDVAEALLKITSNPSFVEQSEEKFVEGVKSGTVIAGISGVWSVEQIKQVWGEDYGACKLPTYTCAGQQVQMSSFTGYKLMGVNAYSDQVAWAHKLAEWLTNEQNQTIRFEQNSQGPSNIKAAASDAVRKVPAIAAVIEQGKYGKLQRIGALYWDSCLTFADTIVAGNPEGKPLQQLMDEFVSGITASTVQ